MYPSLRPIHRVSGKREAIASILADHSRINVRYFEEQPQEFTFDKLPACITVQGYARLAGAAILVSPTLENLALAGVEAICMALRLGLVIEETSKYLEALELENPPESWAALIDDIDEKTAQEELDLFNISTVSSNFQSLMFT
jgi:hypothetical protein